MSSPTQNWELKVLKMIFGPELIIRAYAATYAFQQNENSKEVKDLQAKITNTILRNVSIGVICGVGAVFILQRVFPWYGGRVGFTNTVIDAGILMLGTGLATHWSLIELEKDMQPLKKRWILQHNAGYMRKMREMQKKYQIGLMSQIEGYVDKEQQLAWKTRYDSSLL